LKELYGEFQRKNVMSMVTQYKDEYWNQRQKTQLQEENIDSEGEFAKWRIKSGPPKFNRKLRYAVICSLSPIWLIWALILLGAMFALYINLAVYKSCDFVLEAVKTRGSNTQNTGKQNAFLTAARVSAGNISSNLGKDRAA
jgi:hypothetical protein